MNEVAKALEFIYVDDWNTSVDTREDIQKFKQDITKILADHVFLVKGPYLPSAGKSFHALVMVCL